MRARACRCALKTGARRLVVKKRRAGTKFFWTRRNQKESKHVWWFTDRRGRAGKAQTSVEASMTRPPAKTNAIGHRHVQI
jgi:hypothetical protein